MKSNSNDALASQMGSSIVGAALATYGAKVLFEGLTNFLEKEDSMEEQLKLLNSAEIKIRRYKNRAQVYDNAISKYIDSKGKNVLTVEYMCKLQEKLNDSIEKLLLNEELKEIVLENIEDLNKRGK